MTKLSSDAYRVPHSILETVLYCEDLVAAGEFYEQVIGLALFSHEPNRHRFYQVGSGMLLIFQPETTASQTVQIDGQSIPQHGAHGPGHLAFAVGDEEMEGVRQRLSQHRIRIESEIRWPSGGHSIYCRDPDGNSIEFATRNLWLRSL